MDIDILPTYDDLSKEARDIFIEEISKKNDALICASTGNTPTKTYELVVEEHISRYKLFSDVRIIKLDEWGNIPMDHPKTCASYLQKYLIGPLHVTASRYISFLSNPSNPKQECERIQRELERHGPIDLCILGLGMNGHIALNEPATSLNPHSHVARLSEMTLRHPMTDEMEMKPTYGLTLGMADILQARRIVMLISGAHKKGIAKEFLSGNITTYLPASFLWLHPNVTCLMDSNVAE